MSCVLVLPKVRPLSYCFNPPHRLRLLLASAEALKHPLDVASRLHGDGAGVVLLDDPHKEALLVSVPVKSNIPTTTVTQ